MKIAVLAAVVLGAGGIAVTTLPRPPFPGPVKSAPYAKRLAIVSSKTVPPSGGQVGTCFFHGPRPPQTFRGTTVQRTLCGTGFIVYGPDAASAQYLLAFKRTGFRYGFDFKNYVWPPRIRPGEREFVYEEVVWAREADSVLYVENAHSTYARSSYGQNAYITAVDLKTKKRLWRSGALVANARTFVVTPDYLVTGYGFTNEPDWLYLLDRKTGRVVERLKLPTGPERITKSGDRIVVRTYDHVVVVKLRES